MYKGKTPISKYAERLRPFADVVSVSLVHEDSDRISDHVELDGVTAFECPFDLNARIEHEQGKPVALRFGNGCHPGTLIHEFLHAVFGIEPSDPVFPSKLNEWEWFGLESLVARKVLAFGLWVESSRDYIISSESDFPGSGYKHKITEYDSYEFGDLSKARQKEFLGYALRTESECSEARYHELRRLVS